MRYMQELDLTNKRVLIREDFNVPLKDGHITNDKRLIAAVPTIQQALTKGAAVILMSHLGRPQEGEYNEALSLRPVAGRLAELLQHPVQFADDWSTPVTIKAGEIILYENVRFLKGEKANDENLARQMAALSDVFVMDAFATAHRTQASTTGVAKFAPIACAGPLLAKELQALTKALHDPQKPMIAIVGGAKVSTKLIVLRNLLKKVDRLIVGGGIANTFMLASGLPVGKSLVERNLVNEAKALLALAAKQGASIPLPTDVVVAKECSAQAAATIKPITEVSDDDMIVDIGPETAKQLATMLKQAGTIVWNGPVGVFELPAFAKGTEVVAQAIAESKAFSLAGGGDTVAAIDQLAIADKISYISTGGGAFLEFIQGKELPGVKALTA